jgi:hypothetical protein
MKMKPVIALLAVLSLVGVFSTATLAEVITNDRIPFADSVFVPCANGGAGEWVDLSGTLHVVFHVTVDSDSGYHAKSHSQPQGVTGIGSITGAKYQGTGVTQDQFNGKVGSEYTFVNNFRIIGQGPGNNATVHQNVHVTVNANGEVTANVDNFRAECK